MKEVPREEEKSDPPTIRVHEPAPEELDEAPPVLASEGDDQAATSKPEPEHTRPKPKGRALWIAGLLVLIPAQTASTFVGTLNSTRLYTQFTKSGCNAMGLLGTVPVAGPLTYAASLSYGPCAPGATKGKPEKQAAHWKFAAITAGVQAIGATMMVVGIVKHAAFTEAQEQQGMSWQLVPGTSTTPSGMTLAGRF